MISVMDGRREKEGEGNEGGGGFLTRSMTFDVSFVSRIARLAMASCY
jgi:hypothetical protein